MQHKWAYTKRFTLSTPKRNAHVTWNDVQSLSLLSFCFIL